MTGNEINLVNVYSYLTPIAITLLVLEMAYCYFSKKNYITFSEAVTNLGTAIGNQCMNLLVAFLVVTTFGWLYQFRFFTIQTTFLNFCLLLICFDFLFYWFHRHGHSFNILWAAHMPHHTAEEFNLFVGLRASITQRLFSFFYAWPLALVGFKPDAIYAASAVQLIIAYWHHTRVIKKMGWFEKVFNTPSYHRVHHAINEKYLDKNFGEIFIIWDKMFGTCAVEDEEVVYGALTPVQSCNPNKIYFQYWNFLFQDMIHTKKLWDKIRLWFMPLGWRPEDRRNVARYRVNEKTIQKYVVPVSLPRKWYLGMQAVIGLGLMSVTINLNLPFSVLDRLLLAFVLWLMITSWGMIIEKKGNVVVIEVARISLTIMAMMIMIKGGHVLQQQIMTGLFAIMISTIVGQVMLSLKDRKAELSGVSL